MAVIGQDIGKAKAFLEKGELVAIPTETVYGLAGNALEASVVTQIFKVKNRPSFDPLIVHTDHPEKITAFVRKIPDKAKALMHACWPGPLTVLLPKKQVIPDIVTSGLDTVAVRVPDHPLTLELLQQLDFPLAAPSANPFGYISPTSAAHVAQQLGEQLPYILDGGVSRVGLESTIVSFEHEEPEILRLGGLSVEQVTAVIGAVAVRSHSTSNPQAPGMLKSHYAPRKPLITRAGREVSALVSSPERTGAIVFDHYWPELSKSHQEVLSASGDLDEAARNLFSAMRKLDQNEAIDQIIADDVPNEGLGRAINDRLRRAAAKQ